MYLLMVFIFLYIGFKRLNIYSKISHKNERTRGDKTPDVHTVYKVRLFVLQMIFLKAFLKSLLKIV